MCDAAQRRGGDFHIRAYLYFYTHIPIYTPFQHLTCDAALSFFRRWMVGLDKAGSLKLPGYILD